MSRHYEVMIILDPVVDDRKVESTLEEWLKVIPASGGTIDKVDIWGRRRLAYEIKKNSEGIYAVIDVTSNPDAVKELERQLSLQETVLRTKTVRREETGSGSARQPQAAAV
ncbi:30S ribosomal protein S6 [Haloechinothrix sp. LS1_15]|uniref:30S ribosomal protein S6 n=1 Tax=Haloechinothrix sp. LS1_15 TaxID=2652248 RepID=UPI002945D6F4|nr:30S ribosomal protein S6 [Haloechinothrix sp. LS1_15]MDV6011025.1 30S ribosomal protein S6 [Haloechinothrix sp. LS1_15]